jgi:hypothetical protein
MIILNIHSPVGVHDCVQAMCYRKYCAVPELATDCRLNTHLNVSILNY